MWGLNIRHIISVVDSKMVNDGFNHNHLVINPSNNKLKEIDSARDNYYFKFLTKSKLYRVGYSPKKCIKVSKK